MKIISILVVGNKIVFNRCIPITIFIYKNPPCCGHDYGKGDDYYSIGGFTSLFT